MCALILFASAPVAPARADTPPSAWDIARDPAARDRWALHVRVERLRLPPVSEDMRDDAEVRLELARSALEEADAAHSTDVRLRFDLGAIYVELGNRQRRNDLYEKAIGVLAPAIEQAPDHPAATEAMGALVLAYAKLDRPREELATWRRYLPRILDDGARISPMMNMGEAQMRLGHLDDAMGTFRDTIRMCESLPNVGGVNSIYALALWDLAVALDRSGDPGGALDAAAKAQGWTWAEVRRHGLVRMMTPMTGWELIQDDSDESGVFFVPAWERDWYIALGWAASARAASEPHDAALFWARAEASLDTYVQGAESGGGHPAWLAIARLRRARAHAARVEAERRAAKRPSPPPGGVEWRVR